MAVKQTIPSNTNQTKSLTFSKLRGVDYSSSPFEASTSRAVHMKNMINEDGVNHKRPGWTNDNKINDVFSGKQIIYFSNGKAITMEGNYPTFYLFNTLGDVIFTSKFPNTSLSDYERTTTGWVTGADPWEWIYNDGKYDIDCKIFTVEVLDSKYSSGIRVDTFISISGRNWQFKSYSNGEYELIPLSQVAYKPLTAISINPDSDTTATASEKEKPNIMTNYRRNSLISNINMPFKVTFELESEDESVINSIICRIGETWETKKETILRDILKSKTMIAKCFGNNYKFTVYIKLPDDSVVEGDIYTESGELVNSYIEITQECVFKIKKRSE